MSPPVIWLILTSPASVLPPWQVIASALYHISMGGNDYVDTVLALLSGNQAVLPYLPLTFQQVLVELISAVRVRWILACVRSRASYEG